MSSSFADAALAIAAAFFDSLWEGALLAGAVWLVLCLPKIGASTRHAIWLGTLLALALIPILTVARSGQGFETGAGATSSGAPNGSSLDAGAQRQTGPPSAMPESRRTVSGSAGGASRESKITIPRALASAVALVWVLVVCLRLALLLLDLRELAVIRREAWLWPAAYDFPVFLSNRVHVPIAVGFLRAAVILPASLSARLPAGDVRAIVIHEIAHLRRYDVWTNALARIAEAFLAFNPAALFVMHRLAIEREIACDDWVVVRTGAGDAFARTLATLAGGAGARAPMAAPSALGSPRAIVVRIERLLDSRPRRLRLSPSVLGMALAAIALIAYGAQCISPVLAYAPQPDLMAQVSAAPVAAGCALPKRGIRMLPRVSPASPPLEWELDASKYVAAYGAANVATFDLTVDAAGTLRKVVVLSVPQHPGMAAHVTRVLMTSRYAAELRDCAPVAATIHGAGLPFIVHRQFTRTVIAAAYPSGWSARHPSACKVPAVDRGGGSVLSTKDYPEMLPAFVDSMPNISVDARYRTSVRVHVNSATGAVTGVIAAPSGLPAFDNEILKAALRTKYPPIASACKPSPADYEWRATFSRGTFP